MVTEIEDSLQAQNSHAIDIRGLTPVSHLNVRTCSFFNVILI